MVISMKSLRILLNNTFNSGIEPLQSVLGVSSHPHPPTEQQHGCVWDTDLSCSLHEGTLAIVCCYKHSISYCVITSLALYNYNSGYCYWLHDGI